MRTQPIESRVISLERRVTHLEQLPARIDDLTSQISQLRTEMHGEFSAVRVEMADLGVSLRSEMAELGVALRTEMADQGAASAARDEALEIQMRVLHADVISRFASSRKACQRGPSESRVRKPNSSLLRWAMQQGGHARRGHRCS